MSRRKGLKTGYSITTQEVWFDFYGPKELFGRFCVKEAIDTNEMFFWIYLN